MRKTVLSVGWLCCAVVLTFVLCPFAAFAEPTLPPLTSDGFLSEVGQPYLYADETEGRWVYMDDELSVSITRFQDEIDQKPATWYETEIKCTGSVKLTSLLTEEGKVRGHTFRSPLEIAEHYGAVLAFNDDFYASRWYNDKRQGVVIRNGEIMSDRTFKNNANAFPPLEVLALFEDGSMRTYLSKEHTAQEYLDMGVTDTYAFGPILVHEGELGERMKDKDYSPYREPRCALGMLEKNHYLVLTVEGRSDESRGARLPWLAERMLERGATEALNLDGGNTTCLIFMGQRLDHAAKNGKTRRVGGLIGIGVGKNKADDGAE